METRGGVTRPSEIRFTPEVPSETNELIHSWTLCGDSPVFFENTQYELEFIFRSHVLDDIGLPLPRVEHTARAVEDAFHYSRRAHSMRGSINTGNSVGAFRIDLIYFIADESFRHSIRFDVFPTKMNMDDDIERISNAIDAVYPMWLFALPNKTAHSVSSTRGANRSYLLFWLSQFELLQYDLFNGLKTVVSSPHGRLVSENRQVRLDRVKGRLTSGHEHTIAQYKANGWYHRRIGLSKKYQCVDNPENRFVKHIVKIVIRRLEQILCAIEQADSGKKSRVSESFIDRVSSWRNNMLVISKHPLFDEVGDYTKAVTGSMVLQKRAGYSKVSSAWQRMSWCLDLLAGEQDISLRTVAEMYEVWAFLEVRRILVELGFKDVSSHTKLLERRALTTEMIDGKRGAFRFLSDDGIAISLSHEPVFSTRSSTITSFTTTQIPDIYLCAVFSDGQEVAWIFDAKYRIADGETEGPDLVPDDAINQLHRYRDSLLTGARTGDELSPRHRPVFGAYALYPGKFNQLEECNPYENAIANAGIGGFSLLPTIDSSGSHWLKRFLAQNLCVDRSFDNVSPSDRATLNHVVRTGFSGTVAQRYPDLVIVANQIGPARSDEYRSRFETGAADFYHMRCAASERQQIASLVVRETRFLAVAMDNAEARRSISYVYPVTDIKRVMRSEITCEQAGVNETEHGSQDYWLFSLGRALRLKRAIALDFSLHFELYLCGLEDLSANDHISHVTPRYPGVQLSAR